MAYSKAVSRLSSRLQPSFTLNNLTKTTSSLKSSLHFPAPAPVRRTVRISRLPLELSCVESMMPLHSAIASARLISSLPIQSQCWGLVPQGISMPL
uniref:protein NUCLEAR FUSION DEFECTIVE 6, chloroplastic/mitochondrial n=1 Tax=Fragaria vesca subsp. vesca TaxID=101020 RepID=UPI0005CB2E31|nr:PREDICTED: protein NUCLEAR FUSION DEFECTIVE 6, chloroplastic/mitochondrial [Fragaria vesca subsp. vesca]